MTAAVTTSAARSRVAAARVVAAGRFPYLAAAVFALEPQYGAVGGGGLRVDRAWRLYVDPDVVVEWSAPQVAAVLIHHVGHLLRDHAGRAQTAKVGEGDLDRWVLAADAEINDDLTGCGLDWPERPLVPADLGLPAGRMAEEYYARLDDDVTAEVLCASGAGGADGDLPAATTGGLTPAAAHRLRCEVAKEITCPKGGILAGPIPGGYLRWAESINGPSLDWRRLLTAEVRRGLQEVAGRVDYSYARPSRRAAAWPDVVLPSLRARIPEVAIICDTSGSMTAKHLGVALSLVRDVVRVMNAGSRGIRMLSVDAKVQKVHRVTTGELPILVGRGGTNLVAGFDAIAAERTKADVVVVLTDGHTPWPESAPAHKTVIGLLDSKVEPIAPPAWARTVRIPVD